MIKDSVKKLFAILLLALAAPMLFAQNKQSTASGQLKSQPVPTSSFKHRDIGSPSIQGTFKTASSGIDMTAGGADIWGTKDEFNFAYIEKTGDFDFISRIENLSAANLYTKAGLMAREDLTPGCRHIYFQVFSDNNPRNNNNGGYEFQYRTMKDSLMKAIYPKSAKGAPEFPVSYPNTWIRLQRTGNEFIGYYSSDGRSWKPYTTFTLDLPPKVFLGLAVTSHNTNHSVTAKFRNIAELKH
jgi:hypothetical protein